MGRSASRHAWARDQPHIRSQTSHVLEIESPYRIDRWGARTGQGRETAAANQRRCDICDDAIDETSRDERSGQRGTTLQQNLLNVALGESMKKGHEVESALRCPGQPEHGRSTFEMPGLGAVSNGDEGGRRLIQNPRTGRGAGMAVDDDSQRLSPSVHVANGEVRVVDALCSRSHDHSVGLRPQSMRVGS